MNERILALVGELHEELFSFWKNTDRKEGFAEQHHQNLYDALNTFSVGERQKAEKDAQPLERVA